MVFAFCRPYVRVCRTCRDPVELDALYWQQIPRPAGAGIPLQFDAASMLMTRGTAVPAPLLPRRASRYISRIRLVADYFPAGGNLLPIAAVKRLSQKSALLQSIISLHRWRGIVMNAKNRRNGALLAAAAAALFVTMPTVVSAADAAEAAESTGHCVGANSCKGQSACATANSSCKGQNSCKGSGFTVTTKAECDAASGEFEEA